MLVNKQFEEEEEGKQKQSTRWTLSPTARRRVGDEILEEEEDTVQHQARQKTSAKKTHDRKPSPSRSA